MVKDKVFYIILASVCVITIVLSAIFLRPKKYEVVVRDSLGYMVTFWEDMESVEVYDDSLVSLNSGLLVYALRDGETVEINEHTY